MKALKAWWKRKQLARPDQIARRLIAAPFYIILLAALVAVIVIGWGAYDARKVWRELS